MPYKRSEPKIIGFWPALAAALALTACLTDGPNKTGGEYLDRLGLKLETPLYRVDLQGFPADSFWTEDLDPSRLGDTIMLLGAAKGFTSQARLAFEINDTAFLDSLRSDSEHPDRNLRLSLGFPLSSIGTDSLKATVAGVDSMRVLVESWLLRDTGLSKDDRAHVRFDRNRGFLVRQDTSLLMPGEPVLDTVTLKVKTAYGADSLQSLVLAHLRDSLLSDESAKWIIHMQLTHFPDSAVAMLRLGGNLNASAGGSYAPSLLFGGQPLVGKASLKTQKLIPLVNESPTLRAINSKLRYYGAAGTLLVGKNRGLHIQLGRGPFLDSVRKALERDTLPFADGSGGEFDLSYFVPFARITVPIDTPSRVDGSFPLEFRVNTDLDSLLPAPDPKAAARMVVPLDKETELVRLFERNAPTKPLDTLSMVYSKVDTGSLRRVVISSARDTSVHDTTYLQPGQSKDIAWTVPGYGRNRLIFSTLAGTDTARVDVHFNTNTEEENRLFRDPETGKTLTDLSSRIPRFFKPKDSELTVRATTAVQRLFNRTRIGEDLASDFLIFPYQAGDGGAAADTALKARVPYPVFGEIRPALTGGKLAVDITVYLFPLKVR